MKRIMLALISVTLATLPLIAVAEEIKLPVGQQSAGNGTTELPKRGISARQVEATYGAPLSKQGPVGTPPISSWEYANYWVYFEYDHVLHAVIKHRPVGE